MRVKVLRNIGIQTVREFAEKGLVLGRLQEGKVYEVEQGIGDGLFARGLAEATDAPVTRDEPPPASDQPSDSRFNELSRPAAGTGDEATGGKSDPKQIEPGRQPGSSQAGTGDRKTEKK